jgi:hypothetical protein
MRYFTFFVIVLCVCASAAGENGQRSDWVDWGDPAFLEADYLPPPPDCGLLWHYNTPIHWIRYAEIGDDAQHLFAGGWTGSEDVLGFSMFKVNGEGEPAWQYWEKRGEYAVCAARDADVFYGSFTNCNPYEPRDTFKIYKFHALSRTPDWTYDALAAGYYPFELSDWYGNVVSCSDDGSVMSIMVSDGDSLAVLFFGPDSPEPFLVFEDEDSPRAPWYGGPRRTTLSPDGSKCVFGNAGTGYFLDVESGTLDGTWDSLPTYWLGRLSPDGTISVCDYDYRFSPIRVRRWNGEEFEFLWSYDLPGENIARACGISRDNQRIVVGWAQHDFTQIVLTGFNIDDPTPVWTYESEIYRDEYDNYPTDIELSADGEWVVVGTSGISDSGPPETWVFKFSDPEEPVFTIDNRGLVLSVYITPDGGYMSSVSQSVNHGICYGDCDIYAAYLDPASDLTPVAFAADSTDDGVLVRWEVEEGRGVRLRRTTADAVGYGSLTDEFLPLTGAYLDRDAEPGRTYSYYLRVYADDALFSEFGPVEVERVAPADELALLAPYPSPASAAVTIGFNLPRDGAVELCVYDLAGRRVDTIVQGDLASGRHEVSWDAASAPSGVYLLRLATGSGSLTRRLVVAR